MPSTDAVYPASCARSVDPKAMDSMADSPLITSTTLSAPPPETNRNVYAAPTRTIGRAAARTGRQLRTRVLGWNAAHPATHSEAHSPM